MARRRRLRAKLLRETRARVVCLLIACALLPWACSDEAPAPKRFEVTPETVRLRVGGDFSIAISVFKERDAQLGISFGAEILVTDSTSGRVVTKPTADDVTGTSADALVGGGDVLEITEFDIGLERMIQVAYLCDSPGETTLTVTAMIGEFQAGALRMDANYSEDTATVAVTCTLDDPTPGVPVTESLPASGGSFTVNEATFTLSENPMGYEFTVTDLGRPPIEGAELGSNLYEFTHDPVFPLPLGTLSIEPPPDLGDCPRILRVVDVELHSTNPRFPTGVIDGKPTCQMLRPGFALEKDSSCTTVRVTPSELIFQIPSGIPDCTDSFEVIVIENVTNQELNPSLSIDSLARDIIEPHPDIAAGIGTLAAGETREFPIIVTCPRTTGAEGFIVAGKSPEFVQLIPFTVMIE